MYKIYMFKNLLSGRCYIGQTKRSLGQRYCDWVYSKKGFGKYINHANKHEFVIGFLCNCSEYNKDRLEKFYIEKYKTMYPYGYNVKAGNTHGGKYYTKKFLNQKEAAKSRRKKVKDQFGNIYESLSDFCSKHRTSIDNFHRYKTDYGYRFKDIKLEKMCQ